MKEIDESLLDKLNVFLDKNNDMITEYKNKSDIIKSEILWNNQNSITEGIKKLSELFKNI